MTEPGTTAVCRICDGAVTRFLDLGRQPLSDGFLAGPPAGDEYFYHLAVGMCGECTMVQLMQEVPRELMFHEDYPYYSSGSSVMREHFAGTARRFLETELLGPDPFIVEIGSNDGIMLGTIKDAGVRHLGFEPSGQVGETARASGIRVRTAFFEEATAREVRATEGPADVIYAANTICHIPYLSSIFRGVDALLAANGVFVFEDPYLGDILAKTSFDQIYDEHFFLFAARSVQQAARHFGFELVDVERLAVHGGEVRYTIARVGAREPSVNLARAAGGGGRAWPDGPGQPRAVRHRGRADPHRPGGPAEKLRAENKRVVGYGATAKSATVTNFCGISTDLVEWVSDSTPAKQGRLTPGAHLPVRPPADFAADYPDHALLFAWNHATEIMAKERAFRDAGGKWIVYVPEVREI